VVCLLLEKLKNYAQIRGLQVAKQEERSCRNRLMGMHSDQRFNSITWNPSESSSEKAKRCARMRSCGKSKCGSHFKMEIPPPPPPKKSCLDHARNPLPVPRRRSAPAIGDRQCTSRGSARGPTRSHPLLHCPDEKLAKARAERTVGSPSGRGLAAVILLFLGHISLRDEGIVARAK